MKVLGRTLLISGAATAALVVGATPALADDGANLPTLTSCPEMNYGTYFFAGPDDCVKSLQQSLVAVGFNLDIDGKYGKGTAIDVGRFQRAHGMVNDTGNADSETIALLDEVANSPAALSGKNGDQADSESDPPDPEGLGLDTKVQDDDVDPFP